MISKLQFWTLVVALLAYVAKYFFPDFPFSEQDILAAVLFVLGLIGVYPTVLAVRRGRYGLVVSDIFKSRAFWTLIAGLIGFIARFYFPTFPFADAVILAAIVFVLNRIGINPELRLNGLLDYYDDGTPF